MEQPHALRSWRKQWKVTLVELAGNVGVTATMLSQIETGRKKPSLTLAGKISRATGVPMEAFLPEGA